jgi:hypothetical protein
LFASAFGVGNMGLPQLAHALRALDGATAVDLNGTERDSALADRLRHVVVRG